MAKVVFFGTPLFSAEILKFVANLHEVVLAVTNPDEPVGRKKAMTPPPVKIFAEKSGIKILQPKTLRNKSVQKEILSFNADVGLAISYGKMIPELLINSFSKKILNIHFALLPKYRGATPIRFALLKDEKITGVTLFVLDKNMDTGPIVSQKTVRICKNETYTTLLSKLVDLAKKILKDNFHKYLNGEILPVSQKGESSYCNFKNSEKETTLLSKADGRIDWRKSAEEIDLQVRAFEIFPTSWTLLDEKRLIISDVEIENFSSQIITFKISDENKLVVQNEFKNKMNELLAGHLKVYPAVKIGDKILRIRGFQIAGKKKVLLKF